MDYTSIPKLGFGLMRLPMIGDEVDIEQSKKMADDFIAAGFNYFDTARGYINGLSERAVKPILSDRYPRESFILADKYSWWCIKDGDSESFFQSQLERTGAGYFDFYLLHAVDESNYEKYDALGAWAFGAAKKKEGLVRNFGFSFHGKADLLDKLLTEHPEVDFVQLQLNYIDWEDDGVQSRLCYETARKHGKGVLVMEPVKGGALAVLPEKAREILKAADENRTPASFALRFVASLDGIITVLSGMSNVAQAADNIATMSDFAPLSEKEADAVSAVAEILKNAPTVPCTACKYCTENCPMGIKIPSILRGAYNHYKSYENIDVAKARYNEAVGGAAAASSCIGCGACEEVCPQKLPIRALLEESATLFE
ncbi:MAG: aldo/keto reductase [Clostridia bacterium]|nr:aldo/keto reductase [Clostridia bacterium]